jgi:iron complex outermembrane receptor protein
LLLFTAGSVYAQDCTIRLSGHVEDSDTREKLEGATVRIEELNKEIITDKNGDFAFEALCKGEYNLLITHVDCEPLKQKIKLEKNQHLDLFLPHAMKTLGEVIVEAQKGTPNTGFKKELSGRKIEETRGLSLSEALSKINGVTMLQTGSTISKPVIHGLHSNRILTINNGVRQEGQQWGNEHAPEIDPFIAGKLVVVKGVDELKYGSDAIGGVILVEPKPLRDEPGYAGEINTAYFTNNMQYVVSAQFEQQLKNLPAFRYRIQGTFKKGANATTPDYRLNNTGSQESNFSITAGWKKEKFNAELFYSLFATKLGIFTGSHIGNLTDLQKAIQSDRPADVFLGQKTYDIRRPYQDVIHHLARLKSTLYSGESKFNLQVAAQYDNRQEYDIVRSSSNKKPQLDLYILTLSEDLSWEHPKTNNFSGTVGIAAIQQDNTYSGRYFIPNYFSYTFGAYAIEKWSHHNWEIQGGLRYDNKNIETTRLKYNGDILDHDFHFSTFASSVNIAYKPDNRWRFNTNFSLASRAPHVNELLSDGIHHGTATYERGDINLKPEHSFNINAGIGYQNLHNTLGFEINGYSNRINDFIYQQPMPATPVLTISGAFPLITYQQTDAVLSGFDVSAFVKLFSRLEYSPRLSILYARNRTADDWLIGMPANRISNELSYNFKDGKTLHSSYISVELQNVMKQTRVPAGNQDYKAPPAGYNLVNLNLSTTLNLKRTPLTLSIGVRNAFNEAYRDYLNSMRYFTDEMGRNISFRLRVPFGSSK